MALRPDRPQNRSEQLASRDAAQQDVFLREVDDALRQDEMLGLAKRYGLIIGAAVTAGLLGLAGYLYWDHSTDQAAAERSELTTLALDKLGAGGAALDGAAQDLAPLATDGPAGSKANAAMLRAAIAQQQGKADEAARAFAAIAADTGAPQPFRDLATIREVTLRFDSLPPQQVVDRLKPLAVPGNPWFGSAGELVGLAYLKQGKPQLAGPLFAAIAKDKDVPDSLRSRVRELAAQLGVDASGGDEPAAASDAGPVTSAS